MRVRILPAECHGNGPCVEIAPAMVALDRKHEAIVRDSGAAADAEIVDAAEARPCRAILIGDDGARRFA